MRSLRVVLDEIDLEILLHLLDRLVELLPAHDSEVLIEKRAVKPFDEAVALWPPNLRRPMFDPFELQEELVGMGRPQNSLPLSERTVVMAAWCFSKNGSTSVLSICTAVTGIFVV
jgi:hypothetical protein